MVRKRLFVGILALILLITNINITGSNYVDAIKNEKISEQLAEVLKKEKGFVDVMVLMKEQVSLEETPMVRNSFDTGEPRDVQERKSVIGELNETAIRTQEQILEWLKEEQKNGNVQKYESFFIVNAIHVVAKKSVIETLSKDVAVERIDINEVIKREAPIIEAPQSRMALDPKEIEWNLKNIGANLVWEEYDVKGDGVVVGILDSAVDMTHPALKKKFRGYNEATGQFTYQGNYIDCVDGQIKPGKSTDVQHGSHCVGIMLGSDTDEHGNVINQIGVAPNAKWISARVFGDDGNSSQAGFLKAAQWMIAPGDDADNAPTIINNSWGGGIKNDVWFEKAVQAWRAAKILPVFAAGNQLPGEPAPGPESIAAPANYADSFAVGVVDRKNKLASFSKRGPSPIAGVSGWKPEISAPGVGIRSAVRNGYQYMSGTSMAAPHVCGVAALLKSVDASLTDRDIERILTKTATPATDATYKTYPNHGYGYGVVNAYAAVSELKGKGLGSIQGTVKNEHGEGISAEIVVTKTGQSTKSDSSNGKYQIRQVEGDLTLVCRATGYEEQTKTIHLDRDNTITEDFVMKKKGEGSLTVQVLNQEEKSIDGAYVRILEDSNLGIPDTDLSGKVKIEKIYAGKYHLRVFKDGYDVYEQEFDITDKENKEIKVTLNKMDEDAELEIEDFHHEGKMNSQEQHNFPVGVSGYPGGAVSFIPKRKGGIITNCSVQFGKRTALYAANTAKLSIKALDERGRTITLMQPIDISFESGEVKNISLEKYQIKTDKPYYILVETAGANRGVFLLGVDGTGDTEHSYIYHGENLIPIGQDFVYGALMIKSTMRYPKNAEELDFKVTKPVLDSIYPEKREITGKAESNQPVQIVLSNNVRMDDVADEQGRFVFKLKSTLKPGDEVKCYGKNIDGVRSKVEVGTVLNDKTMLNQNLKAAKNYIDKEVGSENNTKLKKAIQSSEVLLETIVQYEKAGNYEKQQILDYQRQIEEKIAKLKEGILALSPEKKELKLAIEKSQKLIDDTWQSKNGNEVPTTRYWVTIQEHLRFSYTIRDAIRVYEDQLAESTQIQNVLKKLSQGEKTFRNLLKRGKKEVIVIDRRYRDGDSEGEGASGIVLSRSHIVIKITDGKLADIIIKEWSESPQSRKAIEADGFLGRMIEANALDVKPTEGFVKECNAIVDAIVQALGKLLKEGESQGADVTQLLNTIQKAEEELKKYPISEDGKTSLDGVQITKEQQWTTAINHNDLKKAIQDAKDVANNSSSSVDACKKQNTLLVIAIRNFMANLETGPKDTPQAEKEYKDGVYEITDTNQHGSNIFLIELKGGKIIKIDIKKWGHSPGYDEKIKPMIDNIIAKNSPNVDTITHATGSSKSLRNAVIAALKKAEEEQPNNETPEETETERELLKETIFRAEELLYQCTTIDDGTKIVSKVIDKTLQKAFIKSVKQAEKVVRNEKATKEDLREQTTLLKEQMETFKTLVD